MASSNVTRAVDAAVDAAARAERAALLAQRVSMRGGHLAMDERSARYAPAAAEGAVMREGRLGKYPRRASGLRERLGAWHYRWVRVYGDRLEYFADGEQATAAEPKGVIPLTAACRVEVEQEQDEQARFVIHGTETAVLFFAASEPERRDWVVALEAAINYQRRKQQQQADFSALDLRDAAAVSVSVVMAHVRAEAGLASLSEEAPAPLRVLCVGPAAMGASTLLLALQLAAGTAPPALQAEAEGVLCQNMASCLVALLSKGAELLDRRVPEELAEALRAVPAVVASPPAPELLALLAEVYAHETTQELLRSGLSDNVFNHGEFDNLRLWFGAAADDTWDRALHAYRKTRFHEVQVALGSPATTLTLCDFPGARCHRRKWTHWLPDLDVAMFVAAASSYNQSVAERPDANALEEAVAAFGEVWRSSYVKDVPVVLVLTKLDVFARKLREADIRKLGADLFTEYEAGTCSCAPERGADCACGVLAEAKAFVVSLFVAETRRREPAVADKALFYEFVSAVDVDSVGRLFTDVAELRRAL